MTAHKKMRPKSFRGTFIPPYLKDVDFAALDAAITAFAAGSKVIDCAEDKKDEGIFALTIAKSGEEPYAYMHHIFSIRFYNDDECFVYRSNSQDLGGEDFDHLTYRDMTEMFVKPLADLDLVAIVDAWWGTHTVIPKVIRPALGKDDDLGRDRLAQAIVVLHRLATRVDFDVLAKAQRAKQALEKEQAARDRLFSLIREMNEIITTHPDLLGDEPAEATS